MTLVMEEFSFKDIYNSSCEITLIFVVVTCPNFSVHLYWFELFVACNILLHESQLSITFINIQKDQSLLLLMLASNRVSSSTVKN